MASSQSDWLLENLEIIINDKDHYSSYTFVHKAQHDRLEILFPRWEDLGDSNVIIEGLARCWMRCVEERKPFLARHVNESAYVENLNNHVDKNRFPRMIGAVLQCADSRGMGKVIRCDVEIYVPKDYGLVLPLGLENSVHIKLK